MHSIILSREISHPNILSVLFEDDIFIEGVGTCHYITTPYFEGELLEDKLHREGTLPREEAIRIFKGILEGLQYLHSLNLVHNDITPRNIMMTSEGEVKIIDMGHMSHPKNQAGAPPFDVEDLDVWYLANETIVFQFNQRTDIFSATAVFYTMLFGYAPWDPEPFDGKRIEKYKHLIRLRAERGELDFSMTKLTEKYREILRKGLSLNQLLRYKDVSDILTDLDRPDVSTTPVVIPKDPDLEKKEPKIVTPKGFAAIAGMEDLKKMLTERVLFVLKNKRKAEQYRLSPPNGILLYGPPGCGKTLFAEKFAEVNEFLSHLNNCSAKGILVIATSNRPDKIDPAILRTGRIDRQIRNKMEGIDRKNALPKIGFV